MRSLTLSSALAEAIRAHGAETYPYECCGALIGRDDRVTALVPLPNRTDEGPRRRFLVRPSDYRVAEARATELGRELVGFYHSHPDHPARPSQYDLDHAWPNFAYVIVAVMGVRPDNAASPAATDSRSTAGVGMDMTVWFLADDRSAFVEGTLTDGEHDSDSHPAAAVHGQA